MLLWPEFIEEKQHQQIIRCQQVITLSFTDSIIETVTSYNSLLVQFDISKTNAETLTAAIRKQESSAPLAEVADSSVQNVQQDLIEIPVYYGADAGWDLCELEEKTGLSEAEIIRLHSHSSYRAYALGFVPGFCYLANLPHALHLPRRSKPRVKVPAGAVAIAESQTAVYPVQSPGGWHIIGQTPLPMFSTQDSSFSPLISVGDNVKFKAITKAEFLSLGGKLVLDPLITESLITEPLITKPKVNQS